MKKINWSIRKEKISALVGYDKNPRKFTEKGLKDLKKSLETLGDANIITINADNTVLGGHARLSVMTELGYTDVDVKFPDRQLNEKEVQEIVVRLNANTAGAWDYELLKTEFDTPELNEWGLDISFDTTSIEDAETDMPELKTGEKPPFQQIAFTFADTQAETIKEALAVAKSSSDFEYVETYDNENSNGNALFHIVEQWLNGQGYGQG